jgi:hypothetical protein
LVVVDDGMGMTTMTTITLGCAIHEARTSFCSAHNVGQTPHARGCSPTLPIPVPSTKAEPAQIGCGEGLVMVCSTGSLDLPCHAMPTARAGKSIFGFKLPCSELLLKCCEQLCAKSQFLHRRSPLRTRPRYGLVDWKVAETDWTLRRTGPFAGLPLGKELFRPMPRDTYRI